MAQPGLVQSPTAQLYDLPFIGDDVAKIGRVIDLYAAPCQPTAELWVYAFWHNIPTVFISLLKPELVDINIHKGGHRPRKGKRAKFRANAVFRDALIEIPVPSWKVFRLYEWGQRIGWYFLVADTLEDFTINWMSTAYMWQGCPGLETPYATWEATSALMLVQEAGIDVPLSNIGFSSIGVFPPLATPLVPGEYQVSWGLRYDAYEVPGQSGLPETTQLMWQSPSGPQTLAYGDNGLTADGSAKGNSGSQRVQVYDSSTRFRLSAFGSGPNKLCRMSGFASMTLVDRSTLGPDP